MDLSLTEDQVALRESVAELFEKQATPERVRAFRDQLEDLGVNATIRRTRGTEIDAACGQLRASRQLVAPPRRR